MESKHGNYMNHPLVSNIFFSFADKAFNAVTFMAATLIMVRLIPRSDFGIIGVVAGYGVFIQIINIALENAILREHRSYDENPAHYLLNYSFFNLMKSVIICLLGAVIAIVLQHVYSNTGFFWAVLSLTAIIIGDSLVSPFVIYASTRYQQRLVTLANIGRFSLNLTLLFGLFFWPTLAYLFLKDVFVMLTVILTWYLFSRKYLCIDFSKVSFKRDVDLTFIYQNFTKYSIWVHLLGVATNFIYRADALFLSLFASLSVVGNYNIALTTANLANIAPSILGYQNSVAISHTNEQEDAFRITNNFLCLSIYIGSITLLVFLFFGVWYLRLITGESNVIHIYGYMVCIVLGIIIAKTAASPLVAYVNIKGDVRKLFLHVTLPVVIFTTVTYYLAARFYGAVGVATANIMNGMFWIVLLSVEVHHYGYKPSLMAGFTDDLRWFQARFLSKNAR